MMDNRTHGIGTRGRLMLWALALAGVAAIATQVWPGITL
jgi:hypothetical protein